LFYRPLLLSGGCCHLLQRTGQLLTLLSSPLPQVNTHLLEPVQEAVAASTGGSGRDVILVDVQKLEKFLSFFVNNFVRHLVLYQAVLSSQQEELVQLQTIPIQTPLCFPSLALAIPEGVGGAAESGES
jgi:hypothetical protein